MPRVQFVSRSITGQCDELERHFPTYNKEILSTILKILLEERLHITAPTNIQHKIQDLLEDLGEKIKKNK